MKKITFCLLFCTFASCNYFTSKESKNEQTEDIFEVTQVVTPWEEEEVFDEQEEVFEEEITIENNKIVSQKDSILYIVQFEKIDSVSFFQKKKSLPEPKKIEEITDFNQAKQLLKGVVEFGLTETYGDGTSEFYEQTPKIIHAHNGKKIESTYADVSFVAYFPTEAILLCEGGHSSDVSFDLKNGNETEQTGNPQYIVYSPSENIRLNGIYSGQECTGYFIQKKIGNTFEEIISLDEVFEQATRVWLCYIGNSFWENDHSFYFEQSNIGYKKSYFKINLMPVKEKIVNN